MSKSITMTDAEITITGLTFIVDYRWWHELLATRWQPSEPAEVEIISVFVKGQPEADAESLLTAIKQNLYISDDETPDVFFKDGYDLLEAEIKEMHRQC